MPKVLDRSQKHDANFCRPGQDPKGIVNPRRMRLKISPKTTKTSGGRVRMDMVTSGGSAACVPTLFVQNSTKKLAVARRGCLTLFQPFAVY